MTKHASGRSAAFNHTDLAQSGQRSQQSCQRQAAQERRLAFAGNAVGGGADGEGAGVTLRSTESGGGGGDAEA